MNRIMDHARCHPSLYAAFAGLAAAFAGTLWHALPITEQLI
jgi:hypothetical protein